MANLCPVVIDISHHNAFDHQIVDPWAAIKAEGIRGVILKATQGVDNVDATYASRCKAVLAAGMRVGAYHFATNGNVAAQVEHFLAIAKPDTDTLLALDWEKEPNKPVMSVAQAREFLMLLMAKTGRSPAGIWVYGGNVLKEQIRTADDIAFFGQFPLWLCQYGPKAVLPKPWKSKGYGLWQYSDHGRIAGLAVDGNVDLNVFGGQDFEAEWASQAIAPFVTVMSETADEPIAPPSIVKAAYVSPTTWSVGTVAAIITGYFKSAKDAIASLFDVSPSDLVAQAQELLTPAQEMANWFHVSWHAIELTVVVVVLATILIRNVNNKTKRPAS